MEKLFAVSKSKNFLFNSSEDCVLCGGNTRRRRSNGGGKNLRRCHHERSDTIFIGSVEIDSKIDQLLQCHKVAIIDLLHLLRREEANG